MKFLVLIPSPNITTPVSVADYPDEISAITKQFEDSKQGGYGNFSSLIYKKYSSKKEMIKIIGEGILSIIFFFFVPHFCHFLC